MNSTTISLEGFFGTRTELKLRKNTVLTDFHLHLQFATMIFAILYILTMMLNGFW